MRNTKENSHNETITENNDYIPLSRVERASKLTLSITGLGMIASGYIEWFLEAPSIAIPLAVLGVIVGFPEAKDYFYDDFYDNEVHE